MGYWKPRGIRLAVDLFIHCQTASMHYLMQVILLSHLVTFLLRYHMFLGYESSYSISSGSTLRLVGSLKGSTQKLPKYKMH